MKKILILLLFIPFLGYSQSTTTNRVKQETANINVETKQSISCKGKTTKGVSCNNKTKNSSGYCYIHKQQSNPNHNPYSNRLSSSNRCSSNTKSGSRCKRKTYCKNQKCSSHGGNCY